MKTPKYLIELLIISVIALCAGPVFAWDTRWQFKQEAPSDSSGSGTRAIEMQKKFDYNSMNKFKGMTDSSGCNPILWQSFF
jgi:hypothetical protein